MDPKVALDKTFALKVMQHEPCLVAPAEETKKGIYFLSNLDQMAAMMVQAIYCFWAEDKGNDDAAEVLKAALAKVLVHFYPLAGKLTLTPDGKLAVDCTGEGALFVEADADCEIEALRDLTTPVPSSLKVLFTFRKSLPLFQVTRFKCGGFTLGFAVNHCMVDGIAAMNFVHSWAETARMLPLSVSPVINRTPLAARTCPKSINVEDPAYRSFSFDSEKRQRLKREALADGSLDGCTTFEALSAFVWRTRTKALGMEPGQETKLMFVVDGRTRLEPPLPKGYFGNGIVFTYSICLAGELVEKPISFAVSLVQKAIRMIDNMYIRSSLKYSLFISTWTSLAFYLTDFGWWEPLRCGPAGSVPFREFSLFSSKDKGSTATSVLMVLPAAAMNTFQDLIELYTPAAS
ncbi:omega-hydroxypalmitate O-feruloyl transferase-like [Wolffia australiana]